MIQNGGRLPDTGGAPEIVDMHERGVRGRTELDKVHLSVKGVDDPLKAFLIPLLVPHRMAGSHTAALNDDLTAGPGR